jgi:hypothetical protein
MQKQGLHPKKTYISGAKVISPPGSSPEQCQVKVEHQRQRPAVISARGQQLKAQGKTFSTTEKVNMLFLLV